MNEFTANNDELLRFIAETDEMVTRAEQPNSPAPMTEEQYLGRLDEVLTRLQANAKTEPNNPWLDIIVGLDKNVLTICNHARHFQQDEQKQPYLNKLQQAATYLNRPGVNSGTQTQVNLMLKILPIRLEK